MLSCGTCNVELGLPTRVVHAVSKYTEDVRRALTWRVSFPLRRPSSVALRPTWRFRFDHPIRCERL